MLLSKPSEFHLSSIRVKSDDLRPLAASVTSSSLHSSESESPLSEGGSQLGSGYAQHVSRDGSSMAESERLLVRDPPSDTAPDSLSEAAEELCRVADPVWYRHPTVLLALAANCLAGLCFSFLDEVRSLCTARKPRTHSQTNFAGTRS